MTGKEPAELRGERNPLKSRRLRRQLMTNRFVKNKENTRTQPLSVQGGEIDLPDQPVKPEINPAQPAQPAQPAPGKPVTPQA